MPQIHTRPSKPFNCIIPGYFLKIIGKWKNSLFWASQSGGMKSSYHWTDGKTVRDKGTNTEAGRPTRWKRQASDISRVRWFIHIWSQFMSWLIINSSLYLSQIKLSFSICWWKNSISCNVSFMVIHRQLSNLAQVALGSRYQ